jgi:hypothetical protein
VKLLKGAGGLNVPGELDTDALDAIRSRAALHKAKSEVAVSLFASAWNALGYRVRAAHDLNEEFRAVMALGDAPPAEERYRQEQTLFNFTTAALSTLECLYFGAYCLGHLIDPTVFPITKDSDLKFYPKDVSPRYAKSFASDPLTTSLSSIVASKEFADLSDLRAVLFHHGALSRRIQMSTGGPPELSGAFVASNPRTLSSGWAFDRRLEAGVTQDLRDWLLSAVNELLGSLNDFTKQHL